MNNRNTKRIIVLGAPGTGKTTLILKLINAYLETADRKALIVTLDDTEWNKYPVAELNKKEDFHYTGIKTHIFQKNSTLNQLINYYHKGFLVFEDCRCYFKPYIQQDLHSLLIKTRQHMLDVVAVGHGFTEVPPVFFTFCTEIILFKTLDAIHKRKYDIQIYDIVAKAQERINKKAENEPHYFEVIKMQ